MDMDTFEDKVVAWRNAPFPPGSAHDPLDEAHADLALVETWVADSLLPYIDHQVWRPAVPDVFGALDEIERSLAGMDLGPDDRALAGRYVAYVSLLRTAYEAFLEV
jgi:hypothetical protein